MGAGRVPRAVDDGGDERKQLGRWARYFDLGWRGDGPTTWGGAANRLADQMQKWIDENRARLLAQRSE